MAEEWRRLRSKWLCLGLRPNRREGGEHERGVNEFVCESPNHPLGAPVLLRSVRTRIAGNDT